ncbi:MAG: hypothetical protein IJS14_07105 [Lentisphaeria bacterium]|nr:hypothetical protein [Lentisphaeria bacterium]
MTDREFFEKSDFSFEISGDSSEISIRPYIDIESDGSRILIASFHVDSLEMIGSARIPVAAGKNHVPFQQTVRIVKPLLWQPAGGGTPSLYNFSVVFHLHGAPFHTVEKRTGIRFVEAKRRSKTFCVNGRVIRLSGCEPDFAEGGKAPAGNLVRLADSDPELDAKLEYCGSQGLIAALELTGTADPRRIAERPGVCLFTAPRGSRGERAYRKDRAGAALPLFTPDELSSWMEK